MILCAKAAGVNRLPAHQHALMPRGSQRELKHYYERKSIAEPAFYLINQFIVALV
jgi:hypothetical protein